MGTLQKAVARLAKRIQIHKFIVYEGLMYIRLYLFVDARGLCPVSYSVASPQMTIVSTDKVSH